MQSELGSGVASWEPFLCVCLGGRGWFGAGASQAVAKSAPAALGAMGLGSVGPSPTRPEPDQLSHCPWAGLGWWGFALACPPLQKPELHICSSATHCVSQSQFCSFCFL